MSAPTAAPALPFIIIGFIAVTVGVGAYIAYLNEKKRTAALFDVATRMGFTFEPKVSNDEAATLGSFRLFKTGRSRKGKNLMRGRADGADAIVLDYQYTTGSGKSSHTHVQPVVLYPGVPTDARLPDVTLAPEHWWTKIGELFGYQDIDFESSEEFSKNYLLRGPDESAIRAAFGMNVLGFFAQNPGWSVESAGGQLAVYHTERRPKPEELQAFVAETATVRRALTRA